MVSLFLYNQKKNMDKIKCITFDKKAQDLLPKHIKDKMKTDRDNARKQKQNERI